MKFDRLFEKVMGSSEPSTDNFVEFIKSIPGPQLEKIFREDLHIYYTSIEGTSNEDAAQERIEIIANELLKKGLLPEDINTIYKQVHDEVKGTSDK